MNIKKFANLAVIFFVFVSLTFFSLPSTANGFLGGTQLALREINVDDADVVADD